MQRSPNIPPIISLPRDSTASDALLHDILDVIKDNKTYQLAIIEQQDQLHDTLGELGRSLLTNREERHADVQGLSFQVNGLREDLNLLFHSSANQTRQAGFRTTRIGRRTPGRVQTPGPTRRSPDLVDSASVREDPLEADSDPISYRYSESAVPNQASYTPALTYPGISSVTTGITIPPSNNLRPESRQRSSQGSSGLTYVTDDPVLLRPPPGFVPYPDQVPVHRQNPSLRSHVSFQQHSTPTPPPPQIQYRRDRSSDENQSD